VNNHLQLIGFGTERIWKLLIGKSRNRWDTTLRSVLQK